MSDDVTILAEMFKKGDRVRMSAKGKERCSRSSPQHVKEFGDCVGVVQGLTDFNNYSNGNPPDPARIGPEFDVRWEPLHLLYSYDKDDLELV